MRVGEPLRGTSSRVFAEIIMDNDTLFAFGLMGVTTIGMLFGTYYRENLNFRRRTLGNLSAGRTLDLEGDLVHPPIEEHLQVNNLNLEADSSLHVAEMLFPDSEENVRFLRSLVRSQSEDNLSSLIEQRSDNDK
jgi:hypothetical protein